MRVFRSKHPKRTYSGTPKKHYSEYREELRSDFNGRCAYTDCVDVWWGDGFHVDHFAPKKPDIADPDKLKKFKEREHLYTNLVYACPQVNRAKSNDWVSDDPDIAFLADRGYLDPCEVDYNDYFERTDAGGIVPKENPVAKYMWVTLKLYLKRYELYWRIEQITLRLQRLIKLRGNISLPAPIKAEIDGSIADLTEEYMRYLNYLNVNYLQLVR